MKKRVVSLMLAAMMMVVAVGCGKGDKAAPGHISVHVSPGIAGRQIRSAHPGQGAADHAGQV